MSRRDEGLGIFGALAVVLAVVGIAALIAHFLGVLPGY